MLIKAIRAWRDHNRQQARLQAVFPAPNKEQEAHIMNLALKLLCRALADGWTMAQIEAGLDGKPEGYRVI